MTASEYDRLSGGHASVGGRWLANILGANAWGTSLIVWDGQTFPHCMQHQVANRTARRRCWRARRWRARTNFAASGTVDGMRAFPPAGVDRFSRFNSKTVYKDDVESWSTVESAINLTATSPLAFAWQVAGMGRG